MTNGTKTPLQNALTLSPKNALFLDFDGTLAPLQDDPDAVALPELGPPCLAKIASKLGGALVLISGRDVRDLASRVPSSFWRAGGHGLEVCPPGETPALAAPKVRAPLLRAAQEIADTKSGVRLEIKGRVLAIHYRQNPEVGPELIEQISALADASEDYCFQAGKMVIELKPRGVNKGSALKLLMQQAPFAGRSPIMVGDDTTDEDAMIAASEMGGYGIKVGSGPTAARHRLKNPAAVWQWLESEGM